MRIKSRVSFYPFICQVHTPLAPAGCAWFNRDGRWSTYDVSVLKLSNVSFRGKCGRMENTLKLQSPTKLARLGHFPPASQAGRLAGPVFYVCVFSLVRYEKVRYSCECVSTNNFWELSGYWINSFSATNLSTVISNIYTICLAISHPSP